MSPVSGPSSATRRYPPTSFDYDDHRSRESSIANSASYYTGANGVGPSGYPQDIDQPYEEEYDDFPSTSQYASSSGRGTPVGTRRGQSMLQERETNGTYDRPRARTEDQNGATLRQWRKNGQPMPPPPPPPVGALPNPLLHGRPPAPSRMVSDASDMSFGSGVNSRSQPTLRSKFSANRLNSQYENDNDHAISPLTRVPSRPTMRSRSASQPSAYNPPPPSQPPPLPKSHWTEVSKGSVTNTAASSKRGSGSSESTGESSDYSPHSASPITPYGSSDSSLPGSTLRTSRSQVYLQKPSSISSQLVKVKVHFLEDIFVIQVPRTTDYKELVEKVGKKIRLCGPRRDDGPLKVKYVDEDGDMVSLGSTEDVQMAFETMHSTNQVTLYVS